MGASAGPIGESNGGVAPEPPAQPFVQDFEGGRDKPPVLLGILRRRGKDVQPNVFQVVVDPEFESAGPELRGLKEAVEIVVQRAERGERRIVSWSQHDLEVVRTLRDEDPELVARFERRYANALSVAKRWANKLHPEDKPADGQLVGYLAMIGYAVPSDAEAGHVGETVRALRPRLQSLKPLTPAQKRRWDRLRMHNRYDCDGMREVCLVATRELELGA